MKKKLPVIKLYIAIGVLLNSPTIPLEHDIRKNKNKFLIDSRFINKFFSLLSDEKNNMHIKKKNKYVNKLISFILFQSLRIIIIKIITGQIKIPKPNENVAKILVRIVKNKYLYSNFILKIVIK